mgnify:CR=1 FL=1
MKYYVVLFLLLFTLDLPASNSYNSNIVNQFIDEMYEKHDYKKDNLKELFNQIKEEKKLKKFFKKAPERRLTWNGCEPQEKQCLNYKKLFVNKHNIENGKIFMQENSKDLDRASKRFGVPKEIIVAIIGIETRYGRIKGNIRVIDSLSTLAFDYPRRSKFFKVQLEEFLLLSREENFNLEEIEGSIAGAMGYGQFMPDSYRDYAVDFDNDGVRDILNNPIDAIGSVANFLNKKGKWKPNVPIAMKAKAISEVKEITSSFKPYMTEIELEEFGLEATEIIPSNLKFVPISLNLEDGYEYWLGFDNYQSISRYNRSKLYVMAVFEFSNSLSKFL